MNSIDGYVNDSVKSIVDQQEQWLISTAAALGMAIDEFAAKYCVEEDPIRFTETDGGYKAEQTVRLVRRWPQLEP